MAETQTNFWNSQIRHAILGLKVQSAAPKTVPQAATQTVFTVTVGRIMIMSLYGLVTTVIGGTTPSAKYVATPTAGTANDMCTAVAISADAVGTQWAVPQAVGSALIVAAAPGTAGSVSGSSIGGQIVAPGTIGFNVSAADATGAVTHTLYYVALDDGARVAAN